ncbi:hypothetical protein [Microbispora triticiradicis]|uniref:Uncharacterized protein n=2 Tax=Microbispora TaxID=2005 RepID=A0ABY3LQH6_9ACTN|nr:MULTISPECIES: hypothetical protein [Microbispora]TLP66542.1 hypothetical protein FED44_03520 [Microbispora fusca]TYB47435.1 hypothetical protein FXF59_29920 [Microbispora tritici]
MLDDTLCVGSEQYSPAMTNPATLLAEQLEAWAVPSGSSPEDARRSDGDTDLLYWQRHGRAVGLLLEIERSLGGLEAAGHDVRSWWNAVPRWYRAVFNYELPWKNGLGERRPALSPLHMDMLRMLGTFLQYATIAPQVVPGSIDEMKAALGDVEELIKASTELDDSIRHYMLSLVWEMRQCLDEIELFGAAGVRRLTFELAGVMFTRAETLEERDSNAATTWKDKAKRLVATMLGAVGLKVIETGAGEVFQKMLE